MRPHPRCTLLFPAAALAGLLIATPPAAAQARPDSTARRDTTRRAPAAQDSTRRDSSQTLGAVSVRAAYVPRVVGSAAVVSVAPDSVPLGVAAPTLGETMRRLPFLYVRQNSRGESEISVRGSESRQAAVLFEGVPLTLTWDARADVSAVPLAGVQQVDYVRGLSSLLAGPNAIGGVVSVRMWEDHDPARRPSRLARAQLQADQFGGVRSSVAAGGAVWHSSTSSLQARVGGGWRDLPGLARPHGIADPGSDGALRLNTDSRAYDAFAGARYEHAQGRYLSAFASLTDGERGVAPELHIAGPRLWRNPEVSRRVMNLSAGTGALRSRLGIGDAEVAVGLTEGSIVIDRYTDRTYATTSARETGDDRTLSLRLTFDQQLGEYLTLRGALTDARVRYDERIDADPSARYAQRLTSVATELDLHPSRLLSISAGVAQDAAETDEAGGRPPLGRKSGLGWRTGVTWLLPGRGLRLHASASERKRFPALRELYSGALGRFEPNPALRPEAARSAEVGASLFRGVTDLQVVAFTQRISDAVVRVTLPTDQFQRVNRDRFTSTGVELTAGTLLGRAALRGDVTFQRARIADATITDPTQRRPEDVPEVFGSLLLTAPVGRGVEGSARIRAMGATRCTNPDSGSLESQAGAQTVDLGVERGWGASRFVRALRLAFNVENALDQPLYDKCGLPQVGRTFRLGITVG